MPVAREKKIYRTFVISTSLVIAFALTAIFINMALRTRQLISEENLIQARVIFNAILLTRKWNADHGGVWVEKRDGIGSNRYLKDPDIRSTDGRVFTKRNPALMTREISEYAAQEGMFKFHVTSLKVLNPDNAPDEFETRALQAFERKEKTEATLIDKVQGRAFFRYMAPLHVEAACLACHQDQGYKVGDVRGGISLTFDIDDLQRKLRVNTFSIVFFGISAAIVLLGLIYIFTYRLIRKLEEARRQIEKIAITDELTGLYNRRYIMTRFVEEFEKAGRLNTNLSCIIADIDHFKLINDSYGHQTGDEVLREVCRRIKESVRVYDILGRYGGEEFLILLPDASLEQAWNFAERTRVQVKEGPILDSQVCLSLGVTSKHESDHSIDDMIRRADEALYKAKNAGRDRVAWVVGS